MQTKQNPAVLLSIKHPEHGRFRVLPDRIERLNEKRQEWQVYWPEAGDRVFSGRWGLGSTLSYLHDYIERENKQQIALFPRDTRERWANWLKLNFSLQALTHASRFVKSAWKMLFFFGQTEAMGLALYKTNPALSLALAEYLATHATSASIDLPAREDVGSFLGFTDKQEHLLSRIDSSHLFWVSTAEVYKLTKNEEAWRFAFLARTRPQTARIMAILRLPQTLVTPELIEDIHSEWDERYSLMEKDLAISDILELLPRSRLPVEQLSSMPDLREYHRRLEHEEIVRLAGLCTPTRSGGTYVIGGDEISIAPVQSLDDVRAVGEELFISPLASARGLPAVAEWVNDRYEPSGFVSQYGIHAEGRAVGLMFASEDLDVQYIVGRFGDEFPSFYQAAIRDWVREGRAGVTL